ncbi:MAG: lysylphosphatidylglycerol synthase transmembrane domain-containing protein [Polyangiales bacterium]
MANPRRARVLKAVKTLVSVGLIVGIVVAIVRREGMDELVARARMLDPVLLLVAVLAQLGAVGLGIRRWQGLLRSQGIDLPYRWLGQSYLVGRFVGAFTPSTAGLDVYRALDVGTHTGEHGKSTSTILLEKGFGLVGLAFTTFALVPFGARRFFGPSAFLVAFAVLVGAIAGLVFLRRPRLAAPVLRLLPAGPRTKITGLLEKVQAMPMRPSEVARAILLGIGSHALTSACYAAAGLALRLEVSPMDLLVVGNAIVLATLLPISLGGVGVREGTAVVLLGAVNVPVGDATLAALLGYLAMQPPALLGGLVQLRGRSHPEASDHVAAPSANEDTEAY